MNRLTIAALAIAGALGVAVAQQDDTATTTEAAEPEAAAGSEATEEPTTVIDELSDAEIEAELARAEEILDDPDDVEEFDESTPLPADLPLALPSDF